MKKILFITTIAGFLPQFEMNDVAILQSMGYTVHYASNFNITIYNFDANELKERGIILHHIDIYKSPKNISNNYKAVKQLIEIIDSEDIDIIHCHNPLGGVAGRAAAKRSKKKPYVIYTAHGFHFYKGAPLKNWLLYYTAERYFARYTDKLITINQEDYQNGLKLPLRRKKNVSLIHGVGVNKDKFKPNPDINDKKRAELGIPKDAFHMVTAAELNDNKNQAVVIKALKDMDNPNVYYSLCGRGYNEEKLEKLISDYNLTDRVRLLGYRNDMSEILQCADCFVFPTKREGLGVAAIESLLTGVPVISSDNRGTREYMIDGVNGIVCYRNIASEYKAAIEKLVGDAELRSDLAAKDRESAKKFCIEETDKIMREVYEEVDKEIGTS